MGYIVCNVTYLKSTSNDPEVFSGLRFTPIADGGQVDAALASRWSNRLRKLI